jgi:phosphoglycolate phosphatase-like HAD superfamily hydrolase
MIKAIIFDLDGVIIESASIKTRAFELLFADYPDKLAEIVDYHQLNAGISRYTKFRYIYKNMLEQALSPQQETELGERFSEIVLEQILQAPLVPGAVDFLRQNQDRYHLFIASGTPDEELHKITDHRQLSPYFRGIYGTPRLKEEIIKDILDRYALGRKEAVFVGDAESDRMAAGKTGLPFIARINPDDDHLQDCRWRIKDLTELDATLKNIEISQREQN